MPFDVELSCQYAFAMRAYGDMNVRRTTGVGHWLDGPKIVLTFRIREKSTVALEVLVLIGSVGRIPGVDLYSIIVHLPDFDEGIANRIAFQVQDTTRKLSDFPDPWSD